MIILNMNSMIDDKDEQQKFRQFYEEYKNTMYSVAYDITKHGQDTA